MKKVLIGCSVLKKEIEAFLGGIDEIEFHWLEEQLHNTPERLHEEVQKAIDCETDADMIYLSYGLCGNALVGVQAKQCPLVLPKVDDCIAMILYDQADLLSESRRTSYFVPQGWLWGEEGIGFEYDRAKEKYGEKRALKMARMMFKNYKYLLFIKTGVETLEDRLKCQTMAEKLALEVNEATGNIKLLSDMVKDNRDERYIFIEPGETIKEADFK